MKQWTPDESPRQIWADIFCGFKLQVSRLLVESLEIDESKLQWGHEGGKKIREKDVTKDLTDKERKMKEGQWFKVIPLDQACAGLNTDSHIFSWCYIKTRPNLFKLGQNRSATSFKTISKLASSKSKFFQCRLCTSLKRLQKPFQNTFKTYLKPVPKLVLFDKQNQIQTRFKNCLTLAQKVINQEKKI